MMLGAVVYFTFWVTLKWPLAPAIVLGLACALSGVIVERVAVRPFVARGSNSWLMATVALGIGEQQMLAIARGLMARLRVLMLDEPSLGSG